MGHTHQQINSKEAKNTVSQDAKERDFEGKRPSTAITEPIIITSLETKGKGRPLLLGEELDAAIQKLVNNLRAANEIVNRLIVMGAAEKIISHRLVVFTWWTYQDRKKLGQITT